MRKIGITSDIETKHLKMIKNMAIEAENGTKISLVNGLSVIKEYNFITFTNRKIGRKYEVCLVVLCLLINSSCHKSCIG